MGSRCGPGTPHAGQEKGKDRSLSLSGFRGPCPEIARPWDAVYRPVVSAAGGSRLSFVADDPPFCPCCVSRVGVRTALSTSNSLPAEPVCCRCPRAPPVGGSSPVLADAPPPVCAGSSKTCPGQCCRCLVAGEAEPNALKPVSANVTASTCFMERLSCHVQGSGFKSN